jgi:hypothetical protein
VKNPAALTVRLHPSEWLSAWQHERDRLLLPAPPAAKLGEAVAVRVQLLGQRVSATVVGTIVSVMRDDAQRRIEIAPDQESLGAVRLLLAAARGEPVRYSERPRRYVIKLPVVVTVDGKELLMTATSLSEGGCALRWSGSLPTIGETLHLRFGFGSRAADLRGVVHWKKARISNSAVGIRFDTSAGPDRAWRELLAEVAKSRAPEA